VGNHVLTIPYGESGAAHRRAQARSPASDAASPPLRAIEPFLLRPINYQQTDAMLLSRKATASVPFPAIIYVKHCLAAGCGKDCDDPRPLER